jgi:hypothetical protein
MDKKERKERAEAERWENFKKSVEESVEAEFGGSLNGKSRYIKANNKNESQLVWTQSNEKSDISAVSGGKRWQAAERKKTSVYSINPLPGQGSLGRHRLNKISSKI